MSYLLFLDESGVDRSSTPFEVLAGVTVRDQQLWNLVCEIHEAEIDLFGRRLTSGALEMKAKKLLKQKTFRMADQRPAIAKDTRTRLARSCLEKGEAAKGKNSASGATALELAALAQAKIVFAERVLELCGQHGARAFASIVPRSAPRPAGDLLRKDYSYLFERFYYFLEEQPLDQLGLVIFDELERSQCHMLADQMSLYFKHTAKGRMRAGRIIPEPFFVHSELTTAIQLADLVAYIICWGVRFGPIKDHESRKELSHLASLVEELWFKTIREDWQVWSFKVIDDLRPKDEK